MKNRLYLALDVGASNIRIGLGNKNGLFAEEQRTVPTEEYWSEEGLKELIIETLDSFNTLIDEVESIGIGVPGLVDTDSKEMEYCYALEELELGKLEELETEVYAENDANTAVLGEKFYGDGEDRNNIATIIIGSGIGGGIYYSGHLLGSEKEGRSPEPGGIIVGEDVTWDESVGGENISSYVLELLEEEKRETKITNDLTAEELFELSETDEVAEDYVDRLSRMNSRGIASIVNLYGPELITFSGSVAVENPEFMEKSFEEVDEYAINPVPEMKISDLGNDLGLYGALALAQVKDY